MKHKIKIQGYDDRKKLSGIFAEYGYKTWIEKDSNGKHGTERYYICVDDGDPFNNTDEWNDLEIDNLPPDILTGNYDFQYREAVVCEYKNLTCDIWGAIQDLINYQSNWSIRYRSKNGTK